MNELNEKTNEDKNHDDLVETIEDNKDIQLIDGASVPRKDSIERIYNVMIAASQSARYSFVPEKDLFNYTERVNGVSVTKNYKIDTILDNRCSPHNLVKFGYFEARGERGNKEYKYIGPHPFTIEDAKKIAILINNMRQATKLKTAEKKLLKSEVEDAVSEEVQQKTAITETFSYLEIDTIDTKDNEPVDLDAINKLYRSYVDMINSNMSELNESYRIKTDKLLKFVEVLNETMSEFTEAIKVLTDRLEK